MNAGTAIAILLGPLLYRWLANHEGFTLALVKLEAGIVVGLFAAIAFHIAGMIAGHEPSWNADEQVVIFSGVAFIALWEWRAARKPAVRHYDADEIEICRPIGPRWRCHAALACGSAGGRITERMKKISYSGYRFPPEIIHQAIWLYLRFTLSLRDVEDLLAERGVAVSYETVRRWVNHSDR